MTSGIIRLRTVKDETLRCRQGGDDKLALRQAQESAVRCRAGESFFVSLVAVARVFLRTPFSIRYATPVNEEFSHVEFSATEFS